MFSANDADIKTPCLFSQDNDMVKNRMNASSDEDFSYESSTSGDESKVETFEAEGEGIHSVG